MGCGCRGKAKSFVVTDTDGNCVMLDDQGNCVTYTSTARATSAARTASLDAEYPGWQVRPLSGV